MTNSKTQAATPAPARKIFLGIGAVVSRLDGKHDAAHQTPLCGVTTYIQSGQDWNFSNGPKLPINMDNCAKNDALDFNEIEIDDFGIDWNGNRLLPDSKRTQGIIVTSIGPQWPTDAILGGFVGSVYLESDFFLKNRTTIEFASTWPPRGIPGLSPAQLVTIREIGANPNSRITDERFVGFQGLLHGSDQYNYNISLQIPELMTMSRPFDIDKTSVKENIPDDLLSFLGNGYPKLDPSPGSVPGGSGVTSVFIKIGAAARLLQHGVRSPKIPFFMGDRP